MILAPEKTALLSTVAANASPARKGLAHMSALQEQQAKPQTSQQQLPNSHGNLRSLRQRLPIPVRSDYPDETTYKAARRAAGLDCATCGELLFLNRLTRTGPTQCGYCIHIEKPQPFESDVLVRCPSCRATFDARTVREHIQWHGTNSGILTLACNCGVQFAVDVQIEFLFASPELSNAGISNG